ncbi:MAG TPA: hypothetical protein DCM05_06860 [Elusimicrobia bacterium]|nr:hypothetical protein [Elusimicrobiota bacterium]
MKRRLLAAVLFAALAVPGRAADDPLKPALQAAEQFQKGVREASERLAQAGGKARSGAGLTVPAAAAVLEEARGLVEKRFLPGLSSSRGKAASAAKDLAKASPLCSGGSLLSKMGPIAAASKSLGGAADGAKAVYEDLRKVAPALDVKLRAVEQALLKSEEKEKALSVDRARLDVGRELQLAAAVLEKTLKNKPKVDAAKLMSGCLAKTPALDMKAGAAKPSASLKPAAAKPAEAPLGKGGTVAASRPAAPAAKPAAPAQKASSAEAKPKEQGLQLGQRFLEAGKSLFGIGAGIARDAVGIVTDVPVGIAKDLWQAGGKLLKGDFKGAAQGALSAPLHAVERAGNGFVDMAARAVLGGVDIVDTLILRKPLPRPLTADEKSLLGGVYGSSVDLDKVRIRTDSSSHLFLPAHAVGNTIYFQEDLGALKNPDGTLTSDGRTLVHETGHTWQDQNGSGTYLPKAMFANIGAAVTQGDRNKAYEWKPLAAQGVPFQSLNPEQQASVIDALAADELRPEGGKYLTAEETEYARRAMELVRAGKGAP